MRFKLLSVAAICAMSLSFPALAHHSHGNYDAAVWSTLEGTVKEIHRINPHSWVYIEVNDVNGQPQMWALEATNRISLERIGVTREYVKEGDSVKVRCHPLRDGSRGCLLGFLKARDGSVKDWDGGQNTPIPTDF